jgi:integrase
VKSSPKKRRIRGAMKPFTPREIHTLESLLFNQERWRDLALLRLAVDSMVRASDLVRIYLDEVTDHRGDVVARAEVLMKKTGAPVKLSITRDTQEALKRWIAQRPSFSGEWLFPGREPGSHLSVVQYRKIVKGWVGMLGLDAKLYSTHSLRRTKAAELYRQTHNLKAVSILLGHSDTNVTSRYLGIEAEDALALAERVRI